MQGRPSFTVRAGLEHPRRCHVSRVLPAALAAIALAASTTGCNHHAIQTPVVPAPPRTFSCAVSPASVFSGDSVTVTATTLDFNPADTLVYTWSSEPNTAIASLKGAALVDTTRLGPGTVTVKGHVVGLRGRNAPETADCETTFTVKAFEPLTVSCSATPATVYSGETVTITASAMSPRNRPLNYSYSASRGSISGAGAQATLSTGGVPAGPITITCNVSDDTGQTATSQATVTATAPMPPPRVVPQSRPLCPVPFGRDAAAPARIENEAKACLDDAALTLQRDGTTRLEIVGNHAAGEANGDWLAVERAVNAKGYLVQQKGVDAARISVFTGTESAKSATLLLLPQGAPVGEGVTPIDESSRTVLGRVPVGPGTGGHGAPEATTPSAPRPGCAGVAILGYPRILDMAAAGPQSRRFFLFVGKLAQVANNSDDLGAVCGAVAPPSSTCIKLEDWNKATSGCQTADIKFAADAENDFGLRLFPIQSWGEPIKPRLTLPTGLDAKLQGDAGDDGSRQVNDTFASWSWTYEVAATKPLTGSANDSGTVSLLATTPPQIPLLARDGTVFFTVKHISAINGRSDSVVQWFHTDPTGQVVLSWIKSIWAKIAGGSLTLASLIAWFMRFIGKKPKEAEPVAAQPVVAAQAAQPAAAQAPGQEARPAARQPVVLVVNKTSPEQDAPAPRETQKRSRKGSSHARNRDQGGG